MPVRLLWRHPYPPSAAVVLSDVDRRGHRGPVPYRPAAVTSGAIAVVLHARRTGRGSPFGHRTTGDTAVSGENKTELRIARPTVALAAPPGHPEPFGVRVTGTASVQPDSRRRRRHGPITEERVRFFRVGDKVIQMHVDDGRGDRRQ